ncbi:MAG TPA: hypothetical protein VMW75_25735, partial [Thermoanaerobaculia bacterium]|nr:hypothetical protein [Thermoanaerobaculia bacterium]
SWPVSQLLISALVRYQNEADAGPGFFNLALEVGLIHGPPSGLERLEFWLRHIRQVQAHHWRQECSRPISRMPGQRSAASTLKQVITSAAARKHVRVQIGPIGATFPHDRYPVKNRADRRLSILILGPQSHS